MPTRERIIESDDDAWEGDDASLLGKFAGWVRSYSPKDVIAASLAGGATIAIAVNAMFLQVGQHPAPIFRTLATTVSPAPIAAVEPPASRAPTVDATGAVGLPLPRPRPTDGVTARLAEGVPHRLVEQVKLDTSAPARSRGELIASIQRELAQRGFFDGPADGYYGPRTDAAIRDFEHAARLKPSAEPSDLLLAAIQRSSVNAIRPPASVPVNAESTRRDPLAELIAPSPKRVLAVQRALTDWGYGQLRPTGVLDGDTQAVIEKFERDRRLPVTGQVSERLTRELAAVTGRPLE